MRHEKATSPFLISSAQQLIASTRGCAPTPTHHLCNRLSTLPVAGPLRLRGLGLEPCGKGPSQIMNVVQFGRIVSILKAESFTIQMFSRGLCCCTREGRYRWADLLVYPFGAVQGPQYSLRALVFLRLNERRPRRTRSFAHFLNCTSFRRECGACAGMACAGRGAHVGEG